MKCTMILAAAAATPPMAMAVVASCAAAQLAMVGASGTCTADLAACPASYQALIDTVYKECGRLEEGGLNWDELSGPGVKTMAAVCKCSGAEMAAPVFLLAAARPRPWHSSLLRQRPPPRSSRSSPRPSTRSDV